MSDEPKDDVVPREAVDALLDRGSPMPPIPDGPVEFALVGSMTFPTGNFEGAPLGVVTTENREAGVVTIGGDGRTYAAERFITQAEALAEGISRLDTMNTAATMGPMPTEPVPVVGFAAMFKEDIGRHPAGVDRYPPDALDLAGDAPKWVPAEMWRIRAFTRAAEYAALAASLPAGLERWEAQAKAEALRAFAEEA